MKKYSLIVGMLSFAAFLCAQEKPKFDEASALSFFENYNQDSKEGLYKLSLEEYDSNKLKSAVINLFYAQILDLLEQHSKDSPKEFKAALLLKPENLEEFLTLLQAQDKLPKVFSILEACWQTDPQAFKSYTNLAMAIAIVFDDEPPSSWPHRQVSEELLPRKLKDPTEAFKMWIEFRKKGRLLFAPEKLSIEELKFVVSSISSDEDKVWAQQSVAVSLSNFPKTYSSVSYDHARLDNKQYDWIWANYRLKTIKEKGGICVDQAYFASEVAKAKGVPAFILSGAGTDASHAWCAYMLRSGSWNFEVGRYEEARFVTGETLDPQTWMKISDGILEGMRENFRSSQKYKDNIYHTHFAKYFINQGDFAKAQSSIEKANKSDPRNDEAWRLLIYCLESQKKNDDEINAAYLSAMKVFANYPDIDSYYRLKMIERYSNENKKTDAKKVSSLIIARCKSKRPDISMKFARIEISLDIKNGTNAEIYSSYRSMLNTFLKEGNMAFRYLTIPVLEELVAADKFDAAKEIMKITWKALKPAKDSIVYQYLSNADSWLERVSAK